MLHEYSKQYETSDPEVSMLTNTWHPLTSSLWRFTIKPIWTYGPQLRDSKIHGIPINPIHNYSKNHRRSQITSRTLLSPVTSKFVHDLPSIRYRLFHCKRHSHTDPSVRDFSSPNILGNPKLCSKDCILATNLPISLVNYIYFVQYIYKSW